MILSNKLKTVILGSIKPYKNNVKIHTKEQIDNIKESINKYGMVQPICIDKNKEIVIGHGRYFALMEIDPNMEIEVIDLSDFSNDDIKKLRIKDNSLNESEWDIEALNKELKMVYIDIDKDIEKVEKETSLNPETVDKIVDVDYKEPENDIMVKNKSDSKNDNTVNDSGYNNIISCPHCNKEINLSEV